MGLNYYSIAVSSQGGHTLQWDALQRRASLKSDKHRAREPRNLTPTNSLTKVLTKMHTGVYTKISTEMPTKVEALSV